MVYARTIKRRSGNGINASLRNASDQMMAAEISSSQAAQAATIGLPEEAAGGGSAPSTTVPAALDGGADLQSAAPGEVVVPVDPAEAAGSSEAQSEAGDESVPHSTTIPSNDDSLIVADEQQKEAVEANGGYEKEAETDEDGCSNDSLNNNSHSNTLEGAAAVDLKERRNEAFLATKGQIISGYEEDGEGTETETEGANNDPNRLNNNNVTRSSGLLIQGQSVPSSSSDSSTASVPHNLQHNHNVRNNNHLNNILNNNSIQPVSTTTTNNSNSNHHNNNNWWAPPPIQQQSDLRNGGTGKLSLLGSNGANGVPMKFSQGNSAQVAATENGTGAAMLPKAILKCRPNSHPFQVSRAECLSIAKVFL